MIQLTDEMKLAIDNALSDHVPVICASVDADDQPGLAYFGSIQTHSDDQLAFWTRGPDIYFLRRIAANPKVALLYRNPEARVGWQFQGRARPDDDEQVRRTVRERTPEAERERDPEETGLAVIIDIDRVIARGEVLMERDG